MKAEQLSSSFTTAGETPDQKHHEEKGSPIWQWLGGMKSAADKFLNWFNKLNLKFWIFDFGGPVQKLTKSLTGFVSWSGENIAAITAGVSAITAVGAGVAINTTTGISPRELISGFLNFGETVYNFNFDIPDSELMAQITSLINGLYGPAGELLGGTLARLVVSGTLTPPKVQINIPSIALCWDTFNDDIKEDMLSEISAFAWQGIYVAKRLAFLFAFMQGRSAIKSLFANETKVDPKTGKTIITRENELRKLNPDVTKLIDEWGDEENPNTPQNEVKDWRLSSWVENKVENIKDPRIQDFVENFLEGFWDAFRDSVELIYD